MTTATSTPRVLGPSRASGVVVRTVGPVALAGAGLAVVGGLVSGAPAAWGAVVGAALLVVILATSALLMDLVASVASAPVVLVGLVTYAAHLAFLLLALVALERSGLTTSTLDRQWVGGAVVLGAVVWSVAQVAITVRTRIPVYDLPDRPADEPGRPGA
ncbi:hypothetical protein RDV89_18595 [Nocardioides zeae]|uniref:ATP synthase protein I n=1 Tax=Nocardioides imazamoxiresistens TaxID=3231893 RepID=A0ABU3Q0R8_9ACTN|nr:hypothetical protein [Nocardioides zeae]MDT9595103.1 hypothetical protein [Nocardioides zeae]